MRTSVPGPDAGILGLIAAGGRLPLDIARSARRSGLRVAAVALEGLADPALEAVVDEFCWTRLGEFGSVLDAFGASGVRDAVMAGKLPKTSLFGGPVSVYPDAIARQALAGLPDLRDDTILAAIANTLETHGVRLRAQAELVPELLAGAGPLGSATPAPEGWADIAFAWPIAKTIGELDVGQTVVVKRRAVMAIEAIEGTDATVRRGCELAGAGACVVKVAKPRQDPRFDVPTIGLDTLAVLDAGGASILAVEAGATLVLDRDDVVRRADARGIAVVGVAPGGPEAETLR